MQLQEQARHLGVDLERLLPASASKPEVFEVLEENFETVQLFEACQSQWRVVAGLAGLIYLGFEYPGVRVVAQALGVTDERWPDVLMRLQVMENKGVELLNSRSG